MARFYAASSDRVYDTESGEFVDRKLNPQFVFVRTPYNYNTNVASDETADRSGLQKSLTQQQFKEEVDINTIVDRFGLTGELPSDVVVPQYADYTDVVTDYQSALNIVMAADDAFMQLPGPVRERFQNNPQMLMEFVQDPANLEEARKLGIANPAAVEPSPLAVRVVADPIPPAPVPPAPKA